MNLFEDNISKIFERTVKNIFFLILKRILIVETLPFCLWKRSKHILFVSKILKLIDCFLTFYNVINNLFISIPIKRNEDKKQINAIFYIYNDFSEWSLFKVGSPVFDYGLLGRVWEGGLSIDEVKFETLFGLIGVSVAHDAMLLRNELHGRMAIWMKIIIKLRWFGSIVQDDSYPFEFLCLTVDCCLDLRDMLTSRNCVWFLDCSSCRWVAKDWRGLMLHSVWKLKLHPFDSLSSTKDYLL